MKEAETVVTAEAPNGIAPRDEGYAPDSWAFDDEVTRVFDDMLQRSIPQYEVMREAVHDLAMCATTFGGPQSIVMDLGAARGEALAPLVRKFGAMRHFVAVEVSKPMLDVLNQRFGGMVDVGVMEILDHDLRDGLPQRTNVALVLSVLTLMFVPMEHRQRIVAEAFASLRPAGVMLVVEKVIGESFVAQKKLVEQYREHKRRVGYSDEEIDRKALALEGVLVPMTAAWNEQMLRRAGFQYVECFWRWMNFAAWIAIKPDSI